MTPAPGSQVLTAESCSALWELRTLSSPLGRTVCHFLVICSIFPAPRSPPRSLLDPPGQSNHALCFAPQAPRSDIFLGLQSDLHFSSWCSVHCPHCPGSPWGRVHMGIQSSPCGRHSHLPIGYETDCPTWFPGQARKVGH